MEKGISNDEGRVSLNKEASAPAVSSEPPSAAVDENAEKPATLRPKAPVLTPCSDGDGAASPQSGKPHVVESECSQASRGQVTAAPSGDAPHAQQQASGYPPPHVAWQQAGCSSAGFYPPPPYGYPPPYGNQPGYGYQGYGYSQANAYPAPGAVGTPPPASGGANRAARSFAPPARTVKLNLTGCFASGFLFTLGASLMGFIALIGLIFLIAAASAELDTDFAISDGIVRTEIQPGNQDDCIAVISVKGIISGASMPNGASSDAVCSLLRKARHDNVKAIVLDMDTPGGEVTAADEIYREVMECSASGIPVVTCMRSMGASGGYYIACASDWIVANRMTFTGSIGVIMSSFNMTGLGDKIGVKPQVFKSGAMKDAMSPMREMSEPEKAYVQKLVDGTFTEFAKIVSLGREKYKDVAAVKAAPFADGRVVTGADALELGLVDELGGMDNACQRAAKLANLFSPRIVRYSMPQRLFQSLLDMKAQNGVTVNVAGVPKLTLEAGKMYFIMPECIAK